MNISEAVYAILQTLDQNTDAPGLIETPARVDRFYTEFFAAGKAPPPKMTTFENRDADQLVAVSGIRVWSLCEHHMLPFWADATIGYIPNGLVLGLSKFARAAHYCAARLQTQERLAHAIADMIRNAVLTENVGVVLTGVHTCMVMRGVKTDGAMSTHVLWGALRDDPATRAEFMAIARGGS